MIPRIARRGHSFMGAGAYYLHDKNAQTVERVAWAETHNLPTTDPERALRCMAWTDLHSDVLKQESGASHAGRTQRAGNVYCYSLAWAPEQQPSKEDMQAAAYATLEKLGLADRQAVIVAHSDTEHVHLHVIVNLVHPQTGKVAKIRQDQRQLSEWALQYEQEHGAVFCKEREANAKKREGGQLTHYQNERLPEAVSLTELYRQCDTGKAFVSALKEAGYTLAHGDKGRLVVVNDKTGQIQNLVRQIDGAKRKDIEAKLTEAVLASLPSAQEVIVKQREQPRHEPEPVPVVESSEKPAVREPVPRDAHTQQADSHIRRYEEAIRQEMKIVLHKESAPQRTMSHVTQLSGLARHMERAAQHMRRIREWIRTKPLDFWEAWSRKPRRHVQRQIEKQREGMER